MVAGVWDAFAGGLRLWALVLAGMGVVLASAASSFASHVEIEEIARRVWNRLQKPARTWQGEIVRAALLTALGLFAALRPAATLYGLTVIAGALLAFEGLRELFMLVPPRLQEAARHAEEALAEAREKADALGGRAHAGALRARRPPGAGPDRRRASSSCAAPPRCPRRPAFTDACNGDRALCDRRLDQVVFPGAHNSMSAAEFDGWMFPNQELGSVSLLGHGIRALLFDVHYGTPIGGRVKTDLEDEAASQRQVREGRRQGGRRRRDAHPRPPHRAAHRPPRRLPLPRLLRARRRPARRRCSRACGTSSSRTRARSSSS